MNRVGPAVIILQVAIVGACGAVTPPTQPSNAIAIAPITMRLEAEDGTGDGVLRERSRASGAHTVHLSPGERRTWTFKVQSASATYAVSVTYSNGEEGEQETIRVTLDGVRLTTFRDRNSGDRVDGWNQFITDPGGRSSLASGVHTLMLESEGGDGCVEIDVVRLTPVAPGE